ncbi:hypothetical protein [Ancylomarina salipaludis]|uniref:hypothetical protein n=1 Tax=Ancylomarina salipaludis TaxID=2501299 RepID=UPI0013E92AF2|nr:hypothetical protein [Ancylomarina salipaludis]
MITKIKHLFFLSCLKASELIERDIHFKLKHKEKLQLKIHKLLCNKCKQYHKHSLLIEQCIHNLKNKEAMTVDFKKLEKRIIIKMRNI